MNILHYTGMPYTTKYGGIEKWFVEFGKIAQNKNHNVYLAYTETVPDIPEIVNDYKQSNIEVIIIPEKDNNQLLSVIDKYKIDIFISHFPEPYTIPLFVAKNTKCKVFSFFHCHNYYSQLSWIKNFKEKLASTWYRWQVFKSQFYINHFIAVSKAVKKQFCQYCLLMPYKVSNIYLGMNPNTIQYNTIQYNTIPIITCIACHGNCKGIDILIEATKILKARNLKFKIQQVGGGMTFNDGKDTAQLHSLVDKYGLNDCFEWLGVRNDIDDILSNSDIYVQPSRREAISLTVAEAMMHRLPVVASNTDGIPEYINHQINGYLYNNNNPIELADYMQYLIENPQKRHELGENAFRTINSSKFNRTANILYFFEKFIDC